ncbi:MAG: hypothetical protein V1685_01730 [Parcubacteria group bacterium]
MYENPYIQAYGDWLDRAEWDWIITVTVKDGLSIEAVKNGVIDLITHYSARYFLVVEPNQNRRLHIQGLIAGVPNFRRLPIQDDLTWRYGRSEIKPYDPMQGWRFYILKYLEKNYADFETNLSGADMTQNGCASNA